jgi:hypothetical protein
MAKRIHTCANHNCGTGRLAWNAGGFCSAECRFDGEVLSLGRRRYCLCGRPLKLTKSRQCKVCAANGRSKPGKQQPVVFKQRADYNLHGNTLSWWVGNLTHAELAERRRREQGRMAMQCREAVVRNSDMGRE